MLQKQIPLKTTSWKWLWEHFEAMRKVHMKDLFSEDGYRFERFSILFRDIVIANLNEKMAQVQAGDHQH